MASNNPNQPSGPHPAGEHIVPPPRPVSPATAEYRLNHLMLRIKNPEESLKFYCDCLGLHVVFIFNAGPWTVYYLGPRDVACVSPILQVPAIVSHADHITGVATIGTSKGLLELYHVPADASTPYVSGNDYSKHGVGFGHVGFTVPDVVEALDRVKSFGYEIIKPLDEAKETQLGMPDDVVQGKYGAVHEGYKHVFKQLAFVKDPDGYWVEFVPQVVKPPSDS